MATTDTLLTGATVAAGALGGPVAALAVAAGGESIQQALTGSSGTSGTAGAGDYFTKMRDIQDQGMRNSSELLSLQQELQDENRRYSALSNVLRTKHDTSKAAVNNIRA